MPNASMEQVRSYEEPPEQQAQTDGETQQQQPPEQQNEEGQEQNNAKVPEGFQKQVDSIVYSSNPHELNYIISCAKMQLKTLGHAETSEEKAADFSTDGMPE